MGREFENSFLTLGLGGKVLASQGFPSLWSALVATVRHVWRPGRRSALWQVTVEDRGTTYYLYVWDQPALAALLRRRADVLQAAGWPVEPEAFVARHREARAEPLTPLYDLIADAYGDRFNPGRTDVFPGVPRSELLGAFERQFGVVDPAAVFFEARP
jgi:hypothetical protein